MKRSSCSTPYNNPCSNVNTHSIASTIVTPRDIHVTRVLFTLQWRAMTQILLALPVISLFVCLITSLIFHADHINNTICKVYNFLPSISAVTGVSPQRYLWRVCVALHISPRLLVAWVAREFYSSMATKVPAVHRPVYQGLVTLAFCLNLTELATLCGVTYISNKENYPVHEKLFMLFMLASLVYMVCVVRLLHTVQHALSPLLLRSLAHKRWLLGTKVAATFGLLFFFWRHRVHCQPKAFSWFSLCEYVIATCNMLYHVSVALDFSEEHLIVGHIVTSSATPASSALPAPESSSFVSSLTANRFNEHPNDRTTTLDLVLLKEDTTPYLPPTTTNRVEDKSTERPTQDRPPLSPSVVSLCSLNTKDATHNHPLEPQRTRSPTTPIRRDISVGGITTQVLSTIHESPECGGEGHPQAGCRLQRASEKEKSNALQQRPVPGAFKDQGTSIGKDKSNTPQQRPVPGARDQETSIRKEDLKGSPHNSLRPKVHLHRE